MHPIRSCAFAAALLLGAAASQAALLARDLTGDGVTDAYYDDVLDITWLRDWNYAFHVGYDADGRMTWPEMVWTESEIETAASANKAWTWNTMISDQRPWSEDAEFLAVAVRPGDVGGGDVSEPLPAALALLGLGVAGVARRMRVR